MHPLLRTALWALLACVPTGNALAALSLGLYAAPAYTGTRGTVQVDLAKATPADGIAVLPPFALRLTLPAGITYRSGNGGQWSCVGTPVGATTVDCTFTGTLYPTMPQASVLSIEFDTAAATTPGAMAYVATIGNAQYPLPPAPVCAASPSTTGCSTLASSVLPSSIGFAGWASSTGGASPGNVSVWSGQPLEAGTSGVIDINLANIGYGPTNTPVTVRFELPPGMVHRTAVSLPGFTCNAAGAAVTCTTPYMVAGQNGFIALHYDVDANLPVPGPVFLHAAIGNNVVAAPTTCVADPHQARCARLQMPTRTPRVADLRFVEPRLEHAPEWFEAGVSTNSLTARFRNVGEANATATTVSFALPPGFGYDATLNSIPAFTCTTTGSITTGQRLFCTGFGLPATFSGFLSIRLTVTTDAERPGPVPILAAIDSSAPPSTAMLEACALDPSQPQCAWLEIPVWASCATVQGFDTIYCDPFEDLWPDLD